MIRVIANHVGGAVAGSIVGFTTGSFKFAAISAIIYTALKAANKNVNIRPLIVLPLIVGCAGATIGLVSGAVLGLDRLESAQQA